MKYKKYFDSGDHVSDKTTGISGVINGFHKGYAGSADQYLLIPEKSENKNTQGRWVDTNNLELIEI